MLVDFITQSNLEKVESISNTKGRNAKIDLVKSYLHDSSFVELIRYTYNPFEQFNIKKIKPLAIPVETPESIKGFLDFMATKNGANNEDIARAGKITQELGSLELALLFLKVLKKDLKLGMNIRSLNEAGYDIPVFLIQLAHSQSHLAKFLAENPDEFIIQRKYDGNRSPCFLTEDSAEFKSRSGHTIHSCDFHLAHLRNMKLGDTTLDGELLHESLNLQKAQSIISKKDSSHGLGHTLTYQVFDIWKWKGVDVKHLPLKERMELIQQLPANKYIVASPYEYWTPELGNAQAYIEKKYQEAIKEGHEGLILKAPNSIYEGKRSRHWVKVKERDTIDLEVLAINEGEKDSRFVGMLGSVTCELDGKQFNIGSGWLDSERKHYYENQNELIGKTIEIKYWKLSPDGVPLHPSKITIREDK